MTCPVVYEFWADGRPLYVGVTSNIRRRLREHPKYLTAAMTHLRLSFFDDRKRAEAYESKRIAEVRPAHNIRDNPRHRDPLMYDETDPEWEAYSHDIQQEALDIAFRATELGPTPTYSAAERRVASLEFLRLTRGAAA